MNFPLNTFSLPAQSQIIAGQCPGNNIQESKTLGGNGLAATRRLVGQYLALLEAGSAAPYISEPELRGGAELRAGGHEHPQALPGPLL